MSEASVSQEEVRKEIAEAIPKEGSLLRQRRFAPLFWVQALGAFNDNVFKNAFVALLTYRLIAQLDADLSSLTALAAGVFILPFALFAPFAGKISDQMDKAVMMRWVKFAEILIMCAAAAAYHLQDVYLLYFLLFLMGAQSAFFSPIKYGVLPQYLHPEELVKGNGLIQAATFFAILIGTIIGTNLILTESGVLLTSVAVVAIAVLGWIASLFAPPAPAAPDADDKAVGFWTAPIDVVRRTMARPTAFRAILAIGWFWFVGATYMALLPAFAKEQLGADERVLTVLLAAFSIGVAIGSVLCGFLYKGAVRVGVAPWGALGIAIFSIDLMFVGSNSVAVGDALRNLPDFLTTFQGWRVLFDFTCLAICAGIYVTPLNAVYQHASPQDERGRIVACSNLIDSSLMAISAVVIVALASFSLSPSEIFGGIGATGLLAGFLVARRAPETKLGRAALSVWPTRPDA